MSEEVSKQLSGHGMEKEVIWTDTKAARQVVWYSVEAWVVIRDLCGRWGHLILWCGGGGGDVVLSECG